MASFSLQPSLEGSAIKRQNSRVMKLPFPTKTGSPINTAICLDLLVRSPEALVGNGNLSSRGLMESASGKQSPLMPSH